jgi:protein TonB
MHATFGERLGREDAAVWRVSFPEPRPDLLEASPPSAPRPGAGSYGADRRPSLTVIAIVVAAHALLLFALVKFDVIPMSKPKPKPLVVELLRIPPPPPPAAAPPPEPEVAPPPKEVTPVVVAPAPIVQAPAPVALVATAPKAPPPQAVVEGPPAAPAGPVGPVAVDDLSTKMISASPPKYPVESRRRKEQGTVFLSVLVGTDGSVQDVSVSRSSGFARLDKAALDAVRRWRWSPLVRGGVPVMVRGIVDIPFVLQG